uniref:Uncharacterized protein n=1 Tax=Myotis myotis TaxID=51298 RepID=A0A7J8AMT3_MYOMY|nr:hypothetical protein mMyoMyo1_007912 [Myotis myotis]
MRWGAQRNPSKWLGASAQIIARQPPGDSMEKNKDPASFLQDIHHVPCFPGGDRGPSQASLWATSSKRLCSSPPAGVAHSRTFSWSICCVPSMVWVPRGMSSLALVAPVTFFGGHFKQELGNM